MAETNITPDKANGQVILAEHVNELKSAVVTTFSGRDGNGNMSAGQQLGSLTYPWGTGYINNLISNGQLIDFSQLQVSQSRIVSGSSAPNSSRSDFIRAAGSTNEATILGTATPLTLVIEGANVSFDEDVLMTGLVTTGNGSPYKCNINEPSFAGQEFTKYAGTELDTIQIDNLGSQVLSKVGGPAAFRNDNTGEIFTCAITSTTTIALERGQLRDQNGDPIKRQVLNDNDQLTLLSGGFVFVDDDGATYEVSYVTPAIGFIPPF